MIFIAVVVMMAASVGAAFRIERRIDVGHLRAQAPHHILDHVITADDEPVAIEHGRQMPVAEMPGNADEVTQVVTADFSEWLRRGNNFDMLPVLQHQRIACTQPMGLFEIEQELEPVVRAHDNAASMAAVEVEHDTGDGCVCAGGASWHYGCGADHGSPSSLSETPRSNVIPAKAGTQSTIRLVGRAGRNARAFFDNLQ